jgi:hypothetical protein
MGKLLDLIILDTRHYDRSITSMGSSPLNDKVTYAGLTAIQDSTTITLTLSATTLAAP